MKTLPIPHPERLRHVPRQFSWIDHRLVRDRHIQGRSPDALALYLFLCTVADARGTSYYSDPSAAGILSFSVAQLRTARSELVANGLIAWRAPVYQVLSLEPGHDTPAPPALAPQAPPQAPPQATKATKATKAPAPAARPLRSGGEVRSIGDIVRTMMKEAGEMQTP